MVQPDKRHVLKHGLVPSVSKVIRAYSSWALEKWNQEQDFMAAYEYLEPFEEYAIEPKTFVEESRAIRKAKTDAVFERGKSFHAAIQRYILEGVNEGEWSNHIASIERLLELPPYDILIRECAEPERSFVTRSYGGTCDWHSKRWLLDYKTKDRLTYEDGKSKKLHYDEHGMQLAAYIKGLGLSFQKCGGVNVFVGVDDGQVKLHWWTVDELVRCWLKFKRRLDEWWENLE